jgi:hypothetical protein
VVNYTVVLAIIFFIIYGGKYEFKKMGIPVQRGGTGGKVRWW